MMKRDKIEQSIDRYPENRGPVSWQVIGTIKIPAWRRTV